MVSYRVQMERSERSAANRMIVKITPGLAPLFGVVVGAAEKFQGIPTIRA